jgi:predicted membrane protein (TIGR00267 family)
MKMPGNNFFTELKEYNQLVNIDQIARRYFVMNSFDGVLTTLGILIGSFLAAVTNPAIVISATIGGATAMGISGIWGAYLTEHAERKKELTELELMLHTKLKKTKFGRATKAASIIVALIDGIAPFLSAILIMMPFFFIGKLASIHVAYYVSFGITLVLLAGLGIFLGHISKENLIKSALKMMTAGMVCGIVIFVIEKLTH